MLTDSQIQKIKRLRKQCFTLDEIVEKTGIPRSTIFVALHGRKNKAALRREVRARERAEELRLARRHIEYLEQRLRQAGIQPPNRQLIERGI